MEWPTYVQHWLSHQKYFCSLLTTSDITPDIPEYAILLSLAYAVVGVTYSAHAHGLPQILSLQWCPLAVMLAKDSASTRSSPTSPYTQPLSHYLTCPPTRPPKFSNDSIASSLTLLTSFVLHPLLPQTASITSSHRFLIKAREADSNSTSTNTSLTHFTTKSSPILPTTSTSSTVYFLLRHPSLSLGMSKYRRKITWNAGRSAFSLMGGLLESNLSIAKNAACLSM